MLGGISVPPSPPPTPHPVRVTECAAMMCPVAKPPVPPLSRRVAPPLFLCVSYTMCVYVHLF